MEIFARPIDPSPAPLATSRRLGLYALKPWYAARLARLRNGLRARRIAPNSLTWTGVAAGAAAGIALATLTPGVLCGAVVAVALAARLACANLDGALARETGRTSRWGAVVNEVGDRLAELAALAGLAAVAPLGLVLAAAAAASAPSWISLAGAAAGADRMQGGPVGKTERALLLVVAAATGQVVAVLAVLIVGSLLTAVLRCSALRCDAPRCVTAAER
jgi:CDP-diacylglycerol--glycerol-3-phosphate 3-phosphatidyltransferase